MYKQISSSERDLIAVLKSSGWSNKSIAKRLKRSVTTIGRELKRNRSESGYYVSISAQAKVDKRKFLSRSRHPLKHRKLFSWIIAKLQVGWSPEIISGRLKRQNKGKSIISAESIYTFIYSDHSKAQELKLWEYLPRHKKRRTRKDGRKTKKVSIPGRISIHDRPAQVLTRTQAGHWEGDSMEGRSHKGGLHVEVERLTRFILAQKIANMESSETIEVQCQLLQKIPTILRKTVTMDNGRENYLHQELASIGIQTFFADPYSAWQKGTVENAIGIIRRYFPKGTDLINIDQEEIDEVVWEINNRPRKILDYSTPQEVYNTLKGCTSN